MYFSTYQQLKELSSVANNEVAGAAGGGGVPRKSRPVGERDESRLAPMSHEELADGPCNAHKTTNLTFAVTQHN